MMNVITARGQWTVPKNCVYRDVMSGKCVNNNPKQFADHPDKSIKGIALLYLPAEKILNEPDNIEGSPKITEILQTHMVKRFFDQQKVACLEFYVMSTNKEPFFTQCYGEGACGHEQIFTDDSHCGSCLGDYQTNEEWLQCLIYRVWFHNDCFYN